MPVRIGKRTIKLENNTGILSSAGVAGHKESQGPLGKFFDMTYENDMLNEKTWEKAESRLQTEAVNYVFGKTGLKASDIDLVFAGDLLNQFISSSYGLRKFGIPFLGQYGACSTMAQTMIMAALITDSFAADRTLAVTSSHFCSAERQFRLPLEYGGQRNLTAQWTVTGAGAAVIERNCGICRIEEVTTGRIIDPDIKDPNNMGAAMAPAAADTIMTFLRDTKTMPDDYDLILTGDLGFIGSELLIQLMDREGLDISRVHNDCGKLIFYRKEQDVHSGGSGCGCCGSVFCSYIMQKLRSGELKNILFAATGALMSATSSKQGESIPGISHLLHIRACS